MKTKELIENYAAPEISVEDIIVEAGFAASGINTRDLTLDEYDIMWE